MYSLANYYFMQRYRYSNYYYISLDNYISLLYLLEIEEKLAKECNKLIDNAICL